MTTQSETQVLRSFFVSQQPWEEEIRLPTRPEETDTGVFNIDPAIGDTGLTVHLSPIHITKPMTPHTRLCVVPHWHAAASLLYEAPYDQEFVSRSRDKRTSEVELLLTEAGLDDWDGEGGLALSMSTVDQALAFLRACPEAAFLDEIDYAATATGDGDVMLTWAVGYDHLLTVLITKNGQVLHSGTFPTSEKERKGVSDWVDTGPGLLPEGIAPCFDRLVAAAIL